MLLSHVIVEVGRPHQAAESGGESAPEEAVRSMAAFWGALLDRGLLTILVGASTLTIEAVVLPEADDLGAAELAYRHRRIPYM